MRGSLADRVVLGLLAIGLVFRLAFIFFYFDSDWEPDGYNHVLMNKGVFIELPGSLWQLISVWGKPLYTLFFAILYEVLPASWPRVVVTQVGNTALWLASGWLTLRVARDLITRNETLILLAAIIAFSFVSFRASITANTEPFGAAVFAVALYAWHRKYVVWSLLAFGCVILVRTDGGFCVVVFAIAALIDSLRERRPRWMLEFLMRGAAFALPLVVWDLFGYYRTGSPLFVITHGYPTTTGIYGFGSPFHYAVEFMKFDTVLSVLFTAGAALALLRSRSTPRTIVLCALAGVIYFAVMTAMWYRGAFGSAGLLRYFVFAYPAYILVAGLAIDSALTWLSARGASPWIGRAAAGALAVVLVAQLHWLVREPRWSHNLLTRVYNNPVRALPTLPIPWDRLPVHADSPDVLYYLGKDTFYGSRHPVAAARDPNAKGIFVYVTGWTEHYGGIDLKAFAGEKPAAQIQGIHGPVLVFVR